MYSHAAREIIWAAEAHDVGVIMMGSRWLTAQSWWCGEDAGPDAAGSLGPLRLVSHRVEKLALTTIRRASGSAPSTAACVGSLTTGIAPACHIAGRGHGLRAVPGRPTSGRTSCQFGVLALHAMSGRALSGSEEQGHVTSASASAP